MNQVQFKPGDRVRYKEQFAVVKRSGGGRVQILLSYGARGCTPLFRWVKERQLVHDFSRTV